VANGNDFRDLDRAKARFAIGVAAYALGVPPEEIAAASRGRMRAAFGRQLAMYLCHVAFGMSLSRVALAFLRDRSTAAHACHLIEDRREEEDFDLWAGALEAVLRDAPQPRAGG